MTAPLVLRIPRRLDSPNASRGAHWRVRHHIRTDWEHDIAWLAAAETGLWISRMPPTVKMRVTIERHVPSRRNFIKDDDNLAFSVKHVLDSLKRQHLIRDDSRAWLDCPLPTQH